MKTFIVIASAIVLAGCEDNRATESDASRDKVQTEPVNVQVEPGSMKAEPAPDNTAINKRDADRLTPGDQGESEADRTITQQIRQEVVKNDALSMTAKNVKIITVEGIVTLRGPVASDQEKTQIAEIAQRVAGVKHLDNQLEVAAP